MSTAGKYSITGFHLLWVVVLAGFAIISTVLVLDAREGYRVASIAPDQISIRQFDDSIQYKLLDGAWQDIATVSYLTGKDGRDGSNGRNGRHGVDGTSGADGIAGQDGADGQNGSDGQDGADGAIGQDGADGQNGADGRDGADGSEIELQKTALYIQWKYVDESNSEWRNIIALTDLKGEKGDTGSQGAQGVQGAQGIQGAIGMRGPSIWGGISGSLSDQTDLQLALSNRQPKFISATSSTAAATVAKVGTTTSGSYAPVAGDMIVLKYTLGTSSSSTTLNIDGSGAKSVMLQGAVANAIGHRTASNGLLLYYYDGTNYNLVGSQQQVDTDTNTTYIGIAANPTAVTAATQAVAINTAYLANHATLATFTLPTTAPLGSLVSVMGISTTGTWRVVPSSGDNIVVNGGSVSSTGYIGGGQYNVVYLRCVIANTTWVVENVRGAVLTDTGSPI